MPAARARDEHGGAIVERVFLAALVSIMLRLTASRRLICPSTMLSQVGQFASSKSAMKVEAPQLSALNDHLRSVGPVISTRRSSKSLGCGATVQAELRIDAVSARNPASGQRQSYALVCCEASSAHADEVRTDDAALQRMLWIRGEDLQVFGVILPVICTRQEWTNP